MHQKPRIQTLFLNQRKNDEDLQDVGKTPDKKHRLTIHRIISRIEER